MSAAYTEIINHPRFRGIECTMFGTWVITLLSPSCGGLCLCWEGETLDEAYRKALRAPEGLTVR